MSVLDASNPEYVNARVRARRAALYEYEDYRKLVRMAPSEIARYMEDNEYEAEINRLGSRFSGVDLIEFALNENLARNFEDLLEWADGHLYEQIISYLRKFDAWNLKTILRGVYTDSPASSIKNDLILAGEFDETFLDQLIELETVEAVVETAEATVFGDALAEALEDYESSGLLVPLENAIDRTYYEGLFADESASDRATELYVEFLEAEIDFRNIRNALRIAMSGADIDPGEYFIEGGALFSASELRQLAANKTELISQLRDSRYGDQLDVALDDLEAAESLIGFENALEEALMDYSDHLSKVYPLSICPVLAYILAKERELENVRAIARGLEAGLSQDEIEQELVY